MAQTLLDTKRAYYIAALGLTASQGAKMSIGDLEAQYFANPPSGSYATVATTGSAADLTGKLSVEQAPAGTIVAVKWTGSAWPANPSTRTDVIFNYIGGTSANAPANARAGDLWDHS